MTIERPTNDIMGAFKRLRYELRKISYGVGDSASFIENYGLDKYLNQLQSNITEAPAVAQQPSAPGALEVWNLFEETVVTMIEMSKSKLPHAKPGDKLYDVAQGEIETLVIVLRLVRTFQHEAALSPVPAGGTVTIPPDMKESILEITRCGEPDEDKAVHIGDSGPYCHCDAEASYVIRKLAKMVGDENGEGIDAPHCTVCGGSGKFTNGDDCNFCNR